MLAGNIENPVFRLRRSLELTVAEFSALVDLPTTLIVAMEKGFPNHLHPKVFKVFPELVGQVADYHTFRRSRRRAIWPNGVTVVPQNGPEFQEFLRDLDLGVDQFAELALLPIPDVYYAAHHWRLPTTLKRFFEEINP